jgi:hypothetical protein
MGYGEAASLLLPVLVPPKTSGKTCENSARIAGMQAHTMPMEISIVDQ